MVLTFCLSLSLSFDFHSLVTLWCLFPLLTVRSTRILFPPLCFPGAKEAHTVSPHFAQLMYFSLVSALFTTPMHFSIGQAAALARSFWKKNKVVSFFQLCTALTIGFLSVHFFRLEFLNSVAVSLYPPPPPPSLSLSFEPFITFFFVATKI